MTVFIAGTCNGPSTLTSIALLTLSLRLVPLSPVCALSGACAAVRDVSGGERSLLSMLVSIVHSLASAPPPVSLE